MAAPGINVAISHGALAHETAAAVHFPVTGAARLMMKPAIA